MSFLKGFLRDCRLIAKPDWAWQQAWVSTSENLVGFLALFGYMQNIPLPQIFLGVGLAFVCSLVVGTLGHHANYKEAWAVGLFSWLVVLGLFFVSDHDKWWVYTLSTGVFMGLRDAQNVQVLLWIPLRARRKKRCPSQALRVGQILTFFCQVAGILISSFMMTYISYWPYILIVLANLVLIPHFIVNSPKKRRQRVQQTTTEFGMPRNDNIKWLIKTSSLITGASFMGKRLLLPLAFALMTERLGWEQGTFIVFGVVLSFVALLGLVAPRRSKIVSTLTMKRGLEMTALGWLIVVLGFLLKEHFVLSLVLLGAGWVTVELSVKAWGVGYMDTMRLICAKNNSRKSKTYQDALVASFQAKNMTTGVVMISSVFVLGQAPLVVALLGFGAWGVYKAGSHHLSSLYVTS